MNKYETQSNCRQCEEPYVGMPIGNLNRGKPRRHSCCDEVDYCPLAMAYVPWQHWCNTYEPAVALDRGTIFPELDLPFLGGGAC